MTHAVRSVTNYIVVHCAATRPSMDVGAKEIKKWHLARGFADIGYHKVIRRSGKIEDGRMPLESVGAHVAHHNHDSVAVCWVGGLSEETWAPEDNRTPEQIEALIKQLKEWQEKWPKAKILGHRDFPGVYKACPSFDVAKWAVSVGL